MICGSNPWSVLFATHYNLSTIEEPLDACSVFLHHFRKMGLIIELDGLPPIKMCFFSITSLFSNLVPFIAAPVVRKYFGLDFSDLDKFK